MSELTARTGPPGPQLATQLETLDGAVTGIGPLIELLVWARPLDHIPQRALRFAWDEAARLGVICSGRLTLLGRALLTGEREPVVERLRELLPQESGEVLFGSDLTVVAPSTPPAAVVDLLDTIAVRESHGVGATWRISETSVREALDQGYRVEDLLADLRAVAGKALPQTLDYLLRDVDRRHGILGVRPAACVVVSEDEALLAELAATRVLRPLGLALVAPTVLVGTADVPTTLAALRKAGHFPVEEHVDGTRTVRLRSQGPAGERHGDVAGAWAGAGSAGREAWGDGTAEADALDALSQAGVDAAAEADVLDALSDEDFNRLMTLEFQRLGMAPGGRPAATRTEEDPAELIARLRSGAAPPDGGVDAEVLTIVESLAPQLRPDEQRHLAAAVRAGDDVLIHYRNESGNVTERLISELEISAGFLTAYCHLRQDERHFRLDRITMVAPV
ncbi:helicase-associated domain-containing protein [Ornithinimicrobium sp. F0845]|uniref:helicase-associated domain-containing protein n=1 Tax=Ornithinimicrobium sp. F0845 TaxID=2926412 RepID=UPI001FF2823B|nr:helicase-associated domain-containing protein [Ornithinimicrobium sp. F0845]MCK0112802.1 helicase-associated domain-containing protein [Ornithinimicrobium sp. F0845]